MNFEKHCPKCHLLRIFMTLLLFMALLPDHFVFELMQAVVGNLLKRCTVSMT